MTRRTPAQYNWAKQEFDERILTKHITSPRALKVQWIVAHHMTVLGDGKGGANNKCYSIWQSREASAHYGVDGDYLMQFVWDNNAAWATANRTGNHAGISIEHANSKVGPSWEIGEKTWKNGAKLAAYLHVTHKLGRPKSTGFGAGGTLRTHQSFYATSCPGPFFKKIWPQYVAEAQRVYDEITKPKPAPVPPKPVPAKKAWFSLCLWPLPGYDTVYGAKHFPELEAGIVSRIAAINADMFALTEVPGPRVASFNAKLKTVGYKIAVTTDGRTVVDRLDARVGRTKKVTLAEKGPAKDDKQVVLAELWPNGDKPIILSVGHLEYRLGGGYDKARVTQAKQERTATASFAKTCGVPPEDTFFADDENSDKQVLEDAYNPDYVDAFTVADKTVNGGIATICGWTGRTAKGARSDKVKLHKTRRALSATVVAGTAPFKLSDHLPTVVIIQE